MAKKKKKEKRIVQENLCPTWMCTMGDCMSLLLCFFVLMLTFSSPNEAQLTETMGFIKGALGALPSNATAKDTLDVENQTKESEKDPDADYSKKKIPVDQLSPVILRKVEFEHQIKKFERSLKRLGFENVIRLNLLDEGISLKTDFDNLFIEGSARLTSQSRELIAGFAEISGGVGNEIRLTVNVPRELVTTAGRFNVDWTLFLNRLHKVGDILTKIHEIDPSRVSYGIKIASIEKSTMEFLLAEKSNIKEVSTEALTKEMFK